MKDTHDIKNKDGAYKPDAFQKFEIPFLTMWPLASNGCLVAAGDCLLHYMHSGKKKHEKMSPQAFLICFQKALRAVKLLDHCYEKELDNDKAKVLILLPL